MLARGHSRFFVAVAGVPGSGKSTLAARLARQFNARTAPDTMVALGMDGFHLSKAQLAQMPDSDAALARRGAPWTFDASAFEARLHSLRNRASGPVSWPGFDHAIGDPVEGALSVSPASRIILVEGIWVLHDADGFENMSRFFDERWFLDTPPDLAFERLTLRHQQSWGLSREQAQTRIRANDALNADIVGRSAHRADWRVSD